MSFLPEYFVALPGRLYSGLEFDLPTAKMHAVNTDIIDCYGFDVLTTELMRGVAA